MFVCRYCDGRMMGQDNDRMGPNLYSRIHVCLNDECKAVYEGAKAGLEAVSYLRKEN